MEGMILIYVWMALNLAGLSYHEKYQKNVLIGCEYRDPTSDSDFFFFFSK